MAKRPEFGLMTIIAHFNSFGVPTLLGDLLLSGADKPAAEVHVPASRNINERIFLRPNFYIVGLTQKLVLLNSKLAIAWSGRYGRAADLFSSLEPLRRIDTIDASYVSAMLDALDEPIKRDLSWIALVATGSDCTLLTHRVEPLRDYGPITHVTFGGSGSGQFSHIFPQLCRNILEVNPDATVEVMREGFVATVLGALAGEEFDRPLPLQEGWGGGFEVVKLVDGPMSKLTRQLSLNFIAQQQGEEWAVWFVPNLRHTDYWNELTMVQTIEHEIDASGRLLPGRRDVFVVSPPGGHLDPMCRPLWPAIRNYTIWCRFPFYCGDETER
jgi:hypothetical protein